MAVDPDGIPRYAPPTWDELNAADNQPLCGKCLYFKEVEKSKNGLTEYVGVCVFEVFWARASKQLEDADVPYMEPDLSPCNDYVEAPNGR